MKQKDYKKIPIPKHMLERCKPYMKARGYNSYAELIRSLIRDWADMMERAETDRLTGERFLRSISKEGEEKNEKSRRTSSE